MKRKNITRESWIFGWASFLNDFGAEMIYSIWPLFVTSVLKANMTVLGLIDGLGDAAVSISQGISGYVSDRIRKRKVFVWIGYVFGSLSRVGYAFSTMWQHLVPLRILDRAGKIRAAPRDAIIADSTPQNHRGENFGFVRAMDNMGAVIGIVASMILLGILGYKKLFLLASVPSLVGAFLVFNLIKERKSSSKIYPGIRLADLNENFRLFLLLSCLFSLGSFSYSFLLIFAVNTGIPPTAIPALYLLFVAVASASSIPFGRLADAVGRKPVLILSMALWALVCVTLILSPAVGSLLFAFVLFGLHKGSLEPVRNVFVAELAPKRFRASALGGYQMMIGIFALPSSVIAGVLWDRSGAMVPFLVSFLLTLIAIGILFFVKEKK